MMMLIPEAFADDPDMAPEKKAFYEYHGCLVEPWDGPAALTFTDGVLIGAMLDRNGLRPAKYVVTSDGLVVLASELGVLDARSEARHREGARAARARCSSSTRTRGASSPTRRSSSKVATQQPYRAWLDENKIELADLPRRRRAAARSTPRSAGAARRPSATPKRTCA